MAMTSCYTVLRSEENDQRLLEDALHESVAKPNRRRAGIRRGALNKDTKMASPTGERTTANPTQKTVFDLVAFDDVVLKKQPKLSPVVTSVQEALTRLDNDSTKLLAVLQKGLDEVEIEQQRASDEGWMVENEDGELVPYSGKFASEEQGKLINGVVLSLARVKGFDKSLPREKKAAIKEEVRDFIRKNPAMIAGLANS